MVRPAKIDHKKSLEIFKVNDYISKQSQDTQLLGSGSKSQLVVLKEFKN